MLNPYFPPVLILFPSPPPPLEQILEQMVRKRKAKINRRYNSASGKCQNVVARRPNRDVNRSVDLTDEVSGSIPRAIYTHHPTSCLYKVAVVSRMRKSCSLTGSRLLAPRDARSIVNRPVRHRLPGWYRSNNKVGRCVNLLERSREIWPSSPEFLNYGKGIQRGAEGDDRCNRTNVEFR